ncbi:hypothetical protein M3Y99_00175900 [Aphelenchoides fujianensis]|nr:hypothetical protein M3Y99_00175900 [Aphelenchoides fujianensis]
MEFRLLAVFLCSLLACFALTADARFYRHVPGGRTVRVVPVVEVEAEDEATERPSFGDQGAVGSHHLIPLRPDYVFVSAAQLLRNFFERRPANERRRRAELADAFLRRQLRGSLLQ